MVFPRGETRFPERFAWLEVAGPTPVGFGAANAGMARRSSGSYCLALS